MSLRLHRVPSPSAGVSLFIPIFVQHHLRNVTLNLPTADYSNTLHLAEISCLDLLSMNNTQYPNTLMWNKYPIRLTIGVSRSGGLVLYLCCHRFQLHSRKRLHLHVLKKPIHKLCSERPDGLAHAKLSPRMLCPLKASAFTRHPPCKHSNMATLDLTP